MNREREATACIRQPTASGRLRAPARSAMLTLAVFGVCFELGFGFGCASSPSAGYAATSPFPSKYRSVSLPVFRNDSAMRGFERDLAEVMVKQIEQSTPYKVRSEASADTELRGTIKAVDLVQLSKDPATGLANEMMLRIRVDFEWVDLRTGDRILSRDGVESSALFVPSYPAREPLELGRFAAVEQLSRDLVAAMQSNW